MLVSMLAVVLVLEVLVLVLVGVSVSVMVLWLRVHGRAGSAPTKRGLELKNMKRNKSPTRSLSNIFVEGR